MKRLQVRQLFVACSTAVLASALAFACGSEDGPPPCSGAACDDAGREGSVPVEGGIDATSDRDVGLDAGDAGDAAEEASACPGPAGTLDPTFGDGGMVVVRPPGSSAAWAVAVQPDGKVIVAADRSNGGQKFGVLRLKPDGTLDSSFGSGGIAETVIGTSDHNVRALVVQPDGKVIVVGSSRNVGQDSDFAIVRYLPDGALDPAFGTAGMVLTDFSGQIDVGRAVALEANGRIVVAGSTISNDGVVGDMAFARYESDGSLDATFGAAGQVTIDIRGTPDQARGVSLIPGGKIVAAGTTRDPAASRIDIAAVRLDLAGALDPTFGTGGRFISAFRGPGSQVANALAVGSSGTAFLAGPHPPDFGVLALTSAGSLNPAFGTAGLATVDFDTRTDEPLALALQNDGRVFVVGSSAAPAGSDTRIAVARLLTSGGLDPAFGAGGKVITSLPAGFTGSGIAAAAALDTCAIVTAGGWFDQAEGVSVIGIARYRR